MFNTLSVDVNARLLLFVIIKYPYNTLRTENPSTYITSFISHNSPVKRWHRH